MPNRHPRNGLLALLMLMTAAAADASEPAAAPLPTLSRPPVMPLAAPAVVTPAPIEREVLLEAAEPAAGSPSLQRRSASRPALLAPLYVSFGALQGLDAATTLTALDGGATERNPLMARFAQRPAALFAVKAAAVVGSIYLAERLWKKNRVAAVVMMAAFNGAYAAIAVHNYRTVR